MTGDFGVAVHALVFLSHRQDCVNSEQLSRNICTNPARVRKIMAKLKSAGLLETREGFDGGYQFKKKPEDITLRQIAESVEARFVSVSKQSGDVDMECQIASGIGPVMDRLYDRLNEMCKDSLGEITLSQIDQNIFIKNGRTCR